MNNRLNISWLSLILAGSAIAQSAEPDSIKVQELNEVVVEAQLQSTSATVSTYIPTSKQKKFFADSSRSAQPHGNPAAFPRYG